MLAMPVCRDVGTTHFRLHTPVWVIAYAVAFFSQTPVLVKTCSCGRPPSRPGWTVPAMYSVPPRLTVVGVRDVMPMRGYRTTRCGTLECRPRPGYDANPV